jgi:DNA repair protein RecO (recombination protein O)
MVHATRGIVLRTVKYGDTSIICSVYTELFGLQSYMVKGVRQSSRTSAGKMGYFQPGSLLEMEVYHNEMKQLQFIKEYRWSYLYHDLHAHITKNAIAMYIIEMVQHSLRQPEASPELFYLIEDTLKQLDKADDTLSANLPLYFVLHLSAELGFKIQGQYNQQTPILDLQEGSFVAQYPSHPYFIEQQAAAITSQLIDLNFYEELSLLKLNRQTRRELLEAYQHFMALHIADFGELRSLAILQEILS